MGDTAAAAAPVQAPAPTAQPAPVLPGGGRAGRAERRMNAISKVQAAAPPAAEPAPAQAAPKIEPKTEAKTEVAPPKPVEPAAEKPDPAAERGLRQLEQQKKKWLDEQNAAKVEYDARVAKLAQREKELEGKVTSAKDLEGLKPKDLVARFPHYTDKDWHALSRISYAMTPEGKADPRALQAAQEAELALGSRATADKLAELEAKYEKQIAELKEQFSGEFTRRDNASFANRWLEEATKAIPTDKPTFAGKKFANDPAGARAELLAIGQELEKANDGEAPTHAEVLAEFEKRKIAELKALGLDPDALLAPPKPAEPAAAAKPVTRTLNPGAPTITRPENAPKTREERRASALAKVRASSRTTADQTP